MTNLLLGTLIAVSAVQTDTTFAVGDATRLLAETAGGSIAVQTWDRAEIRVEADHSSRTEIRVGRRGSTIWIEPESRRGPTTIVDMVITVPATLDLGLDGDFTEITVEGSEGEIQAETQQGDIRIVGGRGQIRAESVNGLIHVSGASGTIDLEGVAQHVRVTDSDGELYVENVGGSVYVEDSDFAVAEIGSVGGRIVYDGSVRDGGTYFFGSHGGPVSIRVPEGAGAEISVATIWGTIRSNLTGSPSRFPQGERISFTVGNGSATIEAETYGGRIVLTTDAIQTGGADGRWRDWN